MPITLLTWCIFSFLLLILITSIKINIKLLTYFRWLNVLALLPLLSVSLAVLKLSYCDQAQLIHSYANKLIPLNFTLHIDIFTASFLVVTIISLSITLLTANFIYLASLTAPTILCFFSLITAAIFSDLFTALCILCIGEIVVIFSIIYSSSKNFSATSIQHYSWLIITNFIPTIIAYFLPSENLIFILLLSYVIKIFLFPAMHDSAKNYSLAIISNFLLTTYIIVSSSIVLTKALSIADTQLSLFSLLMTSIAVLYSLLLLIINFKRHREIYLNLSSFSLIILFSVMHIFAAAKFLIGSIIFSYPLLLSIITQKNIIQKPSVNDLKIYNISLDFNIRKFATIMIDFIAQITATIIGPLYGSVLLLKIPQIIIGLVQIPLRIFHNGSIRRSVLFIVIMVISYYYIWEPQ